MIQSPANRINHMRVIEFPLWLSILCYIIAAIFVLWMLRAVYKYIIYQKLIAKRKSIKATLVSKVKERYRETKVYNNSMTSNRPAPGFGGTSKRGIAYRLYFDVDGKNIELDVDKKIFESVQEGSSGILTYKGCMFYSFDANENCDKNKHD